METRLRRERVSSRLFSSCSISVRMPVVRDSVSLAADMEVMAAVSLSVYMMDQGTGMKAALSAARSGVTPTGEEM